MSTTAPEGRGIWELDSLQICGQEDSLQLDFKHGEVSAIHNLVPWDSRSKNTCTVWSNTYVLYYHAIVFQKFRDRSFRDVCLFQVKGNTSGNMDNENRAG